MNSVSKKKLVVKLIQSYLKNNYYVTVRGKMKKKILVLAGYYVPSVKGGGPIQSITSLVNNLSDKLDFYILATDRDLGDEHPFHGVETEKWVQVGSAKVFYINTKELTLHRLVEIINSVDYDACYLNSFFSYKFSIAIVVLNKLKRLTAKPIILAPRGEFSQGALGLKSCRKKLYIKVAKALGLYKDIMWHATAETEKKDLEAIFSEKVSIKVANNLTANYRELKYDKDTQKNKGELKIVFVSRIHPKKNLKKAIELLNNLKGNVEFDIYGPMEDKQYWSECEEVINSLPQMVKVSYKGLINHDEIMGMFKDKHIFLFPTLGENFGHVISEALIGGCPVIISDQTPWRGLDKLNVGWDIALSDEDRFIEALQYCIDWDKGEYDSISKNAFEYGKKMSNKEEDIRKTYELFTDISLEERHK